MKKFFTLLAAAALSLPALATTFTFTSAADVEQTSGDYTVTLSKGAGNTAPAYYNEMRLYAQNTITVTGPDITRITLSCSKQGSKEYATLTASAGSLVSGGVSTGDTDWVIDTWTGSANSITFTLGNSGQRVLGRLMINEEGTGDEGGNSGSGGDSGSDLPPTLNPDFKYPEPTLIGVPSNKVQGEAYTFVENNVQVSCTKGAVSVNEYFSAHAGYEMTFTATQPIKGIVINGFVKKDFEATVDHGKVSYLSPSDDSVGSPVVVITDVDSKSVTISCVKQLRCYDVEVYFTANPDATVSGGGNSGNGESVDLSFDTAEAVYESEFTDMYGFLNYSIFLYNEADWDPYFALDIYPDVKDNLAGTYSWSDYTLGDYTYYVYGAGDDDFTWAEDGEVTISKNGNVYTITGWVFCDNGNTYNISFTGEMPIYTDDEYYGDGGDGGSGVEAIESIDTPDAPAYDLQGRRVSPSYRGIVIRNGRKSLQF